jgi:hypothetical protein
MTKTKSEKRKFKAHDNLIFLVIERQAGTIAKSALEAVMNSIDAGATRIDVNVNIGQLQITDDGKGFKTKSEIANWFEEFGNPHDTDEDGYSTDATYGTFRSGRGQLFAFGQNTWETNQFKMEVNVKQDGLGYTLHTRPKSTPGCKVTVNFYEPLSTYELRSTVDEITKFCLYVDTDLYINGTKVNKTPATENWSEENDLAWVKLSNNAYSGVAVYQLGVYVETIPTHIYGVSGVVVTKKQVKLNFARNQVIRSCQHWKAITKLLKQRGDERIKSKTTLNDAECQSVISRVLSGDVPEDFAKLQVFTDTNGRGWSINQLKLQTGDGSGRKFDLDPGKKLLFSFAPRGDQRADRAMQQRLGIVFDETILAQFDCDTPEDFFIRLYKLSARRVDGAYKLRSNMKYAPLSDLSRITKIDHRVVDDRELTKKERLIKDVVENIGWTIRHETVVNFAPTRIIRYGISEVADGWTDGASYIALNREFVKGLKLDTERGWNELMMLLLHEWCHESVSSETHNHTPEFYERYHNATRKLPGWVQSAYRSYLKKLKQANSKLTKAAVAEIMLSEEMKVATCMHDKAEEIAA